MPLNSYFASAHVRLHVCIITGLHKQECCWLGCKCPSHLYAQARYGGRWSGFSHDIKAPIVYILLLLKPSNCLSSVWQHGTRGQPQFHVSITICVQVQMMLAQGSALLTCCALQSSALIFQANVIRYFTLLIWNVRSTCPC